MMTTVMTLGWNEGFRKVHFTHLMKDELGLRLRPAKQITDRIMEGEVVELQVPDDKAEQLLAAMVALGARCEALEVLR